MLSYSVIMLNTDQHNKQVCTERGQCGMLQHYAAVVHSLHVSAHRSKCFLVSAGQEKDDA